MIASSLKLSRKKQCCWRHVLHNLGREAYSFLNQHGCVIVKVVVSYSILS